MVLLCSGQKTKVNRNRYGSYKKMAKKIVNKDLLVSIDIGTSKVVTLVGHIGEDGVLQVIGYGSHPSQGLKKGVVVNIESTVLSIQKSVEEAERMAGCEIYTAYTGIAGSHIRSLNSHGIVAIRDRAVSALDVERVIEAAKAIPIPADQKILHVLPQEYFIDSESTIREPIGMSGVRLEAKVHIVTGAVSAAQNIITCMNRCGLTPQDIVLEQFASSQSILSDDEKERGICMIDIGGGTSDIAIFSEGAIRHTAVIPIAGDQVTNDIAITLRVPKQHAERIKLEHGSVSQELIDANHMIDIPIGERNHERLSRRTLAQVIEARYEELFSLVLSELRRSGFDELIAAGIVLTGGASKVAGAVALAERVFGLPVRIGAPKERVTGLPEIIDNPIYATGVGLLMHGLKQRKEERDVMMRQSNLTSIWSRMKSWFQGNF